MSKKPPVAKKEEPAKAAPAATPEATAAAPAKKAEKGKREKKHKEEKGVKQCTRSKATKSLERVQLASDVDPATLWQITMTGTLVATADSLGTNRNKQF